MLVDLENYKERKEKKVLWPWPNSLKQYKEEKSKENFRLLAKDAFFVSLALFLLFSWFEWRSPGSVKEYINPKILILFSFFSLTISLRRWLATRSSKKQDKISSKSGFVAIIIFSILIIKETALLLLTTICPNNFIGLRSGISILNNFDFVLYLSGFITILIAFLKDNICYNRLGLLPRCPTQNKGEDKIIFFKNKHISYTSVLVIVVTIGFLLRIISSIYGKIDLDEGIHLYDAKLIIEGLVPFRDYFTREPYFIYLLSQLVKIFGANLATSRTLSVVASTATVIVVFFISKKIFNKKIALIASAIFSLSPYFIYNSFLGNLNSIYTFVLGLFLLSFVNSMKHTTTRNSILSGFLLGISAHFYRLAIFYFPVIGFIWGWYLIRKTSRRNALYFFLFMLIPFLLPLIYFSIKAGYKNFEIIYGTNELIISLLISTTVFFLSFVTRKKWLMLNKNKKLSAILIVVILAVSFSIYSFFNVGLDSKIKTKILSDMFLQSWHIIFLIIISIFIFIKKVFPSEEKIITYFQLLLLVALSCLAYYGFNETMNLQNFGVRIIPINLKNIFFISFLFSNIVIFFVTKKEKNVYFFFPKEIFYWLLLMAAPAIFYIIHVQINVNNFMPFSILGSIMAACGIWIIFETCHNLEKNTKKILIVSVFIILFSPVFLYATTPLRDRMWPQQSRKDIEKYILENTKEEEEIFTNALIFPLETGRRSFLDLSRSSIYAVNPVYMPDYIGASSNLLSSASLANAIEENCNLILMDNRTSTIFNTNMDFKEIIKYYHEDKRWPDYNISAWKKNDM